MAPGGGRNAAWCGDTKSHCSTFIASLFHDSGEHKAGRPRRHEGSWLSLLRKTFQ